MAGSVELGAQLSAPLHVQGTSDSGCVQYRLKGTSFVENAAFDIDLYMYN